MSRPNVGDLIPVGAIGDAEKQHVLEGKTFSSENAGVGISGTMPNRGAYNITPSSSDILIPAGYHNGAGKVYKVQVDASKVLTGTTIAGTAGTMPNQGAVVITPGTSNKIIPAGYHSGSGYVRGDANLIPDNIRSGKTIFGVSGSLLPASSQIIAGTKSMSKGSTTAEVSIPDLQSTKSFLLFNWYMDSVTDADATYGDFVSIVIRGRCLSSSIKFERREAWNAVKIAYYVITLPNITVRHGSGTIAHDEKYVNITIPSVDVDKSVVTVSGTLKSTSDTILTRRYLQAHFVRAYLTSSTTLKVERDVTFTSDYEFYYQVITFD